MALIATIAAAPIASSWHELTVRHVRCAEHDELTHVPTSRGPLVAAPVERFASLQTGDVETPDSHDHCSGSFVVRGRANVTVVRAAVRYTPPLGVTREVREVAPSPGRAFVLASAPKTSPPSA